MNLKKILLSSFFAVGATIVGALLFFHHKNPQQLSMASSGDRVVVGVKDLDERGENKLYIIGYNTRGMLSDPAVTTVEASKYFHGDTQGLSSLDPRFLFLVNRLGIQSVYGFNIKVQKFNPGDGKASLPHPLIDGKSLSRMMYRTATDGAAISEVTSLFSMKVIKIFGSVYETAFAIRNNDPHREASELLQLIEGAVVENKYPQLTQYFPKVSNDPADNPCNGPLANLGAALSETFMPGGKVITKFISASRRLSIYCTKMGIARDTADLQQTRLARYAESQNLLVRRVGAHNSILYYDRDHFATSTFNGHGLDTNTPAAMEKKIAEWETQLDQYEKGQISANVLKFPESNLVPLAVYFDNGQDRYLSIVNFAEPDRQRRQSLLKSVYNLALSCQAIGLATGNPVAWGLAIAEDGFRVKFKEWRQSSFFEDFSLSFADLLAYLEAADPNTVDWGQVDDRTLLLSLESMGLSADQKAKFTAAVLNHGDATLRNTAINQILMHQLQSQAGTVFFPNGGNDFDKKFADSRKEYWNRFERWMSDPENLKDESEKLTAKAAKLDEKIKISQQKAEERSLKKTAKEEAKSAKIAAAPPVCYLDGALRKGGCPAGMMDHGRPVILFMVDGLSPDLLAYYSTKRDGVNLVNLNKYFLKTGVEMKASFTTHTVSVPSFSTILTGYETDWNGLITDIASSRDPKLKMEDYLDYLSDTYFYIKAKPETRSLSQIRKSHVRWLPDYLPLEQSVKVLGPIRDNEFVPYIKTAPAFKDAMPELLMGALNGTQQIDLGQANYVTSLIKKNPGRYRLVLNYYTTIDHTVHAFGSDVGRALLTVDHAVGQVMETAKKDPVLKDAVLILLSDHGMSGGTEYTNPEKPTTMVDQSFNTVALFTGDDLDYPEYQFRIGSMKGCEHRDVVSSLDPTHYTPFSWYNEYHALTALKADWCRGTRKDKNPGRPGYARNRTMYLESGGDGRVAFQILDDPQDPSKRKTYYELTHYSRDFKKGQGLRPYRNIPLDLVSYKERNGTSAPELLAQLNELHGYHPVDVAAIPLQATEAQRQAIESLAGIEPGSSMRDPVLFVGYKFTNKDSPADNALPDSAKLGRLKFALAFIRDEDGGKKTLFKYVVMKSFDQDKNGAYSGAPASREESSALDPAHYAIHDPVSGAVTSLDPARWYSDRDIVNTLLENERFTGIKERRPTEIFAAVRSLTLNSFLKTTAPDYYDFVTTEIADFQLFANEGFHFNPEDGHQADHGGVQRRVSQTTLFVSDDLTANYEAQVCPVFTRDITPTVLDYLGVENFNGVTQGLSLRPLVDGARNPGTSIKCADFLRGR